MNRVFISYKREEMDFARRVRLALRAEGVEVWWDENLQGGQQWALAIDEAILEASVVVVLWSGLSVQSDWVKHEASIGKSRDILVPAVIDACSIPAAFASIQAVDLIGWNGEDRDLKFVNLREAVTRMLSRRAERLRLQARRVRVRVALATTALVIVAGTGGVVGWRVRRCPATAPGGPPAPTNKSGPGAAVSAWRPPPVVDGGVGGPTREAGRVHRHRAPVPDDVRGSLRKPLCIQDATTSEYIECSFDDFDVCRSSNPGPGVACVLRPESLACLIHSSPAEHVSCYPTPELCEAGRDARGRDSSPCVRFGAGVFLVHVPPP